MKRYESLSKFAADRLLWAVQSLYWVLIANPGTQEKIERFLLIGLAARNAQQLIRKCHTIFEHTEMPNG